MLYRERQHADLRSVAFMTLGRFPGTALGMLLIAVPEAARNGIIGTITLAAVALLSTSRKVARTRRTEAAAGFFSGAADYLSAMGGPPRRTTICRSLWQNSTRVACGTWARTKASTEAGMLTR